MKRFWLYFAMALLAGQAPVHAQGNMIMGGSINRGHVPVAIQAGSAGSAIYGDAGPALNSLITELGITNTGTPFVINDAPPTGPYHQLVLGANAVGGGLISYNAYNGASALPLQCNINGVFSACLGLAATLQNNIGNFVPDTSPFPSTSPVVVGSFISGVMGSVSTPDTTTNFEAIFQKIGTQTTSATLGGAILGSLIATSAADFAHGTAIVGQAQTAVNYPGTKPPFIEGTRGQCDLLPLGGNTQCNGMSAEVNRWSTTSGAFGIEGADNNDTGIDPSTTLNPLHLDSSFLASCGVHGPITGAAKCFAAYLVNPNAFPLPQLSFHYGFYVGGGSGGLSVDTASFRSDSNAPIGIDLEGSPSTFVFKSASGFHMIPNMGTGGPSFSLGLGLVAPTPGIIFYEGGGTGNNWDQEIAAFNGTGAQGTGYLAITTGGLRLVGSWLQVGTGSGLPTLNAGEIGVTKNGLTLTAPGAGFLKVFAQAGTNAGTCKLVALAGTSVTPVTIIDNVGSGC